MNELSIIIPCLSEASVIPRFIDELAPYVMGNPTETDIIIVLNETNESIEGIADRIKEKYPWLKIEILQRSGPHRSFGALARFGVAYSTSKYVVFVSPYGEDDISIIGSMLKKMRAGSQLVQATRYTASNHEKKILPKFRIYQHIYRSCVKCLLGFDVSDSTYGFKMFDRIFIQALGLSQNGWSICSEIQLKTLLAGGKVDFEPCKYHPAQSNRTFKVYKEFVGYIYLLIRGLGHRLGVLWF